MQCHFVAYRPAASVREFISGRNDWLEILCDYIKKTSVLMELFKVMTSGAKMMKE